MGKLGKKARKFARKNLQSVLKQRRKFKSMRDSFKRKKSSRADTDNSEDDVGPLVGNGTEGNFDNTITNGALGSTFRESLFCEGDNDSLDEASESDGFLEEDSNTPYLDDSENKNDSEEGASSGLAEQNKGMHLELIKQKKKLDGLTEKDVKFSKFLERHNVNLDRVRSEEASSGEDEASDLEGPILTGGSHLQESKILTRSTIDAWCQLVLNKKNLSVLPNLLNGFRAACHYGTYNPDANLGWNIKNKEAFCKILMFMLREADSIFRRLLGVSTSSCKKETLLELMNSSKGEPLRPLIKSYLRSTLILLSQVTDYQVLEFTLSRLKASVIFLAAFPSLQRKLIKVAVHLWATGGGTLSISAFFIIGEMAVQLNSDCLDTCLVKTFKAFIDNCKFVDPSNMKHVQFLGDCLVELYSIDTQKSYQKALVSIEQLARILQLAIRTKKKEALKSIYNWQYMNCIDLWVKFISTNIRDHDLRSLLYLVIQIVNGVSHLFTGPRYFPLRLKCIQILNQLSSSSGVFIPVASLVLSSLEYRSSNTTDGKPGLAFNFASALKVPKQLLKSKDFQKECVISAIELLSAHFAQWSYHISFPEIATIPLIRLRKYHETTNVESHRHLVKSLIEKVEQNVEYVQKKRDEVAFSPKDQADIDAFLQLEKSGSDAPFTKYYASVLQKSITRNQFGNEKISLLVGSKKWQLDGKTDGKSPVPKKILNSVLAWGSENKRRKRQKT